MKARVTRNGALDERRRRHHERARNVGRAMSPVSSKQGLGEMRAKILAPGRLGRLPAQERVRKQIAEKGRDGCTADSERRRDQR